MFNKIKSVKGKILFLTIIVLFISNISIGVIGYIVSKQQLNEKGEIILQNGVDMAIQMIDLAQKDVEKGKLSLEDSQERVKEYLLGEMQSDGTRPDTSPLDLGEHGYFVVYGLDGEEIAHPSLEGQNMWDVKDKSKNEILLVQDSIKKAESGGGFTYYDWFLPGSETIGKKIVYNKLDPNWGWVVTAGSYEMDFNRGAINVLKFTSIWILFSIIIASAIIYYFSNIMGRALEGVAKRADMISNLDVSEDISENLLKRQDEIGMLAVSFQRIIDNLRIFVVQIGDSSSMLSKSSQELTVSSGESAAASEEVARAIEDIAKGASEQAMDTEIGANHINDLGSLVEINEDYLRKLNDSTKDADKLKDEGILIIGDLVKATEASNNATKEIRDVIIRTNESAERIENASNMISNIAEQTNLLALNAAIEAARAGEAGRGFAVVADEIRKLAEESNKFTEDITAVVTDLSNKTNQAVTTMEEVTSITELQSKNVADTNDKFIGIANSIENISSVIHMINESGKQMIEKKDMIIEIIQNLSAISEENAAGTQEASASVEEQTATMAEIASASEALGRLAIDLQEGISKFKY